MKILKPIKTVQYERNGLELFADALYEYGLEYSDILDDGEVHRVLDRDKSKGNKNGWYVLNSDGEIYFGAYGSWSRAESIRFCSVSDKKLTIEQSIRIHQKQKEMQERAEASRALAASKAEDEVEKAPLASPEHPYLVKKKIRPHGIFQKGKDLLIPVYNPKGEIRTYQTISLTGKFFLKDGEIRGNFYRIGEPTAKIFIAEGFATGATIHELTKCCVYIAFNEGNLLPVSEAVRIINPNSKIVIAGDNDQWTVKQDGSKYNPGLESAKICASKIKNCSYVFPLFNDVSSKPTDFNDLFILEGPEQALNQLGEKAQRIKASPIGKINASLLPKREFLYGNHLIRKYCSATISPGGVGKTQLVMTDAIALATGRMLLHDRPYEQVNAWHYNLEDPMDELIRRSLAICKFHNIDPDLIQDSFFLNSGRDAPLIVMEKTKQGEYARPDADALYQTIKENNISVLSIDPFVKVHYGDENSNKDVDEVLKIFSQIANDTGCAIDLVHHTKKASKGESYAGSMDSARGASALSGAVRAARTITVMNEEEAQAFQIKDRTWYVRLDNAKSNMSAPAEFTQWLERQSIDLQNGDKVGTLGIWKPPSLFQSNTESELIHLLNDINMDDYRRDRRSENWVGYIIMDKLSMSEAEAKRVISKWFKEGVFVSELVKDLGQRKSKWCVKAVPEKLKK